MNHQPSIVTTQHRCVVIVDALSTGRYLPAAFTSLGYPCIHVKNTVECNPYFDKTFSPSLFSALIEYRGSVDEIVAELREREIVAVIAGSEPGVELAIELGRRLERPLTDGRLSGTVFRNKLELYRTLGYGERLYIEEVVETTPICIQALERWLPIVVKPVSDAGSSGVKICERIDEVHAALHSIFSAPALFNGTAGQRAVLMSKIMGAEYMVNTVTANGTHRVLEVWRTQKAFFDRSPAYGVADLVEPGSPQVARVEEIAVDALRQLGVKNSAAHIEIIAPDDGSEPVVIDFGLRLQGLVDPSLLLAAYGTTTILESALAAIDPKAYAIRPAPAHLAHCRSITLHVPRDGTLSKDVRWDLLESLPGVHSVRKAVLQRGASVSRTRDGFSSFGTVYLIGDESQVERATEAIRRIERDSPFYDCIT
ncbi:ATP-grasp domain-containing protein [Paraburkholderia flava]|uniref:ATP-grasp domain-containing protein n=1 Tax=Paraburkholderia flava TaxID=2547393 RepID=UPI001061CA99|nr:ATP-grasp domain-containing protein [Paraburkholderia flava]